MSGAEATSVTGARSFTGSYGSLYRLGLTVKVSGTISMTWPSGALFATISAATVPVAPGRFWTTTMTLRIAENFRAVFYAPFYAIRALGLAEREGLEVEWLPSDAPGSTIGEVKRGAIDAQWGGPMRVLKDQDSTPVDGARLVCF